MVTLSTNLILVCFPDFMVSLLHKTRWFHKELRSSTLLRGAKIECVIASCVQEKE